MFNRKRARSKSDPAIVAAAKVEKACSTEDKKVDFDYEETSDVLDAALEKLRCTTEDAQHRTEGVIRDLRSLSFRPPAPGPVEKLKVGNG